MRIALLSNVTIDLLADMLRKKHEVYLPAGFNTWQQEVFLQTSDLYSFKPEAVIILIYADAYFLVLDGLNQGLRILDDWMVAIKNLSLNLPKIPIFVSSIDIIERCQYGAEQRYGIALENYFITQIEKLRQSGMRVFVLPVKEAVCNVGRNDFYSPKMWYLGAMPYSLKGLSKLVELIDEYISALKGMRRKCLVVDLDNTLWGGVIGEDGIDGLILSDIKEGARFKDTQLILKKMKDRGVILAILSKNNIEDVEIAFNHPEMVLRHEDFAAEMINWNEKYKNIQELSKELNIGLDSFVFLDDNPAEREEMKLQCPDVAIVDFPTDSSLLPKIITKVYNEYFLALDVTDEDLNKTVFYQAEHLRQEEAKSTPTVEEYLKKLHMKLQIHFMKSDEEKRVVQLINKTNQFNLTTKRYSEQEINSISKMNDIVVVYAEDKYGIQGLISVLILINKEDTVFIDTFLMSCRVMGRKIEYEIMAQLKDYFIQTQKTIVRALYIKTAKNEPVENLYEKLGFEREEGSVDRIKKEYRIMVDDLPDNTGLFDSVITEL